MFNFEKYLYSYFLSNLGNMINQLDQVNLPGGVGEISLINISTAESPISE